MVNNASVSIYKRVHFHVSFGVPSQNCCLYVATLVKPKDGFFGGTKSPWHSNNETKKPAKSGYIEIVHIVLN